MQHGGPFARYKQRMMKVHKVTTHERSRIRPTATRQIYEMQIHATVIGHTHLVQQLGPTHPPSSSCHSKWQVKMV